MRKIIILLFMGILLFSLVNAAAPPDVKGYWEGKGLSSDVASRFSLGTQTPADLLLAEQIESDEKKAAEPPEITQEEIEGRNDLGVLFMFILFMMALFSVGFVIYLLASWGKL